MKIIDVIIVYDEFVRSEINEDTLCFHELCRYKDYFVVQKREDQDYIFYCDVVDELIRCKYKKHKVPRCCECEEALYIDRIFLENISLKKDDVRRNDNSVKLYCCHWGT